jgi:dienelactone hydrolase
VFSHGNGSSPQVSSILLNHLASHGFVVAAPKHDDCTSACPADYIAAEQHQRQQDVETVIEAVLALSSGQDFTFANQVDAARIGLVGWSFGGDTALRTIQGDERIRAALLLAPSVGAIDPMTVTRPVMFVAGRLDALAPFQQVEGFYMTIPLTAPDRWFVAIPRAGHSMGDSCIQRSSPGFDFALAPCQELLPQADVNAIVARWGTAFLLRFVSGDPQYASLLDPASNNSGNVAVTGTPTGSAPVAVDSMADPEMLRSRAVDLVCQANLAFACGSLRSGLKVKFGFVQTGALYDASTDAITLDNMYRFVRVDGVAAALIGGVALSTSHDATCDAIGARETDMARFWQWQYPNGNYPSETAWDARMAQIVHALGQDGVVHPDLDPRASSRCPR